MPSSHPGVELSIYDSHDTHRRNRRLPPADDSLAVRDLPSLPLELHYLIIAYLDLESLLALRRTSRLYRHVITTDLVRQLFIRNGRPRPMLTACCKQCLSMPGLDRLVVDTSLDVNSWRSVCFRCWSNRITQDYHLNPWPVVQFVSGGEGYVCHFCNWPVVNSGRSDSVERLHALCRSRRRLVVVIWMIMAFLQFGLGVICAVLGWTRYSHQPGVLIPSSIDFGLAMLSVVVFLFRICTNDERRYVRALFMELILTILRLPPVAYSARTTVVYRLQAGLLPKFGFGIFLINLIFRVLDFLGHALLNTGYDPRRFLQKGLSRRKKVLYGICTFLVYFAYIPF
ncbi:hypothetical protein F5Y19DRAFT_439700 [Xylariaceae sp. FL1651]|nr:hypothetical protein F5Y19DRAFT_439700 [Xylariaceae sp. FL1651]